MKRWRFDRVRAGRTLAQGIFVHAKTYDEAFAKAKELLSIDGNLQSDELRLDYEQTAESKPQKSHLGDGVYAEFHRDRGMIKLYTSNGIEETNVIWLEGVVYQALEDWVHVLCEDEVDREEADSGIQYADEDANLYKRSREEGEHG